MQGIINTDCVPVPKAHAPAADTAAIITLAAAAGVRNVVDKIFGSYSAAPTGGSLTIAITVAGTAVSMVAAITAAGPFDFDFPVPLQGDENTAITITLAAPGGAVAGSLNAIPR